MFIMQVFRNDYDADRLHLIFAGETSSVLHARNWSKRVLSTIDCAILVTGDCDHGRRCYTLRDGKLVENIVIGNATVQTLIDGRAA